MTFLRLRLLKLRSSFSNRKNVVEQKCTKGVSPTAFLRNPSPERGEAYTVLLGEVKSALHHYFYFIFYYYKYIFTKIFIYAIGF
jgi:hypothetical protein